MPIYWYYTHKETGQIKKKMRKNVTKENIKQIWNQQVGRGGLVAYLLNFIDNLDLNYPPEKLQISGQIQGFTRFMDGTYELPLGILQRFIEPADDRNCNYISRAKIQAFWSKSVTLFTKRVCKKSFTKKARCWFLFCGNLQFEDDKQIKNLPKDLYTQSQIKIPKSIENLMSVYKSRPLQLNKEHKCIRCWQLDKQFNFIDVLSGGTPLLYRITSLLICVNTLHHLNYGHQK